MLSKIASQEDKELIKSVEIGDLSMLTNDIAVYNPDQVELLELPNSPPIGSLGAARELSNSRFFRIDLAVVSPEPKQPQSHFPLGRSQSQGKLETITDGVKTLNKQAGG